MVRRLGTGCCSTHIRGDGTLSVLGLQAATVGLRQTEGSKRSGGGNTYRIRSGNLYHGKAVPL